MYMSATIAHKTTLSSQIENLINIYYILLNLFFLQNNLQT